MAGEIAPLLQDLAIILATAGVATILFHRLRQPVVLGYLLAGVVVGPYTPPFLLVSDPETVRTLGEIGVIFLLFALGLEFNFRKLRRVGPTALVSGTLQVLLMGWIGYAVGRAFGLEPLGAAFLGGIVSISSTVIIVKVVSELRQQHEEWAQIVFGILIVEDVLAVLMLTLLGAAGGAEAFTFASVGRLLVLFALFILVALVAGILVVPRLVSYVARLELDDVLVVTSIGLGFGLAVLGGLLGFSPALGAFIMGALIAESPVHKRIEEKIVPIRDLFTAIFFVTVGMLLDPRALVDHWPLILAVTAAVIVGKIFAGSFSTFLTGRDVETSLRVGFGLAQVGEFSFIIAALALTLGATDAPLYAVAVSAAAVTAFTTPYLIRLSPRASRAFQRLAPRPLLTYATLYSAWTSRLRQPGETRPAKRALLRSGAQTLVYGAAAIAVLVFGGASVARVGGLVAARAGAAEAALAGGWFVIGLLALPFLALYVRAQRRFARTLAQASLPERAPVEGASAVSTILERTFFLGGLVVAGALLLLIASPFVPTAPVLALVAIAVAVAAALLYRALARFQANVDEAVGRALAGSAAESTAAQERLVDLMRTKYPWAAGTREVELPLRGVAAPSTIRRLHLRGRTGASIVTIHRAGLPILNPPPDTHLLPGDRLVLMGEDAQLDAAERLLLADEAPAAPTGEGAQPREVRVEPGSAMVDRTLEALRLPDRTGVSVLGIQRGARRIANPTPGEKVLPGDTLVVLATEEQHARVMALAGAGDGDSA